MDTSPPMKFPHYPFQVIFDLLAAVASPTNGNTFNHFSVIAFLGCPNRNQITCPTASARMTRQPRDNKPIGRTLVMQTKRKTKRWNTR